MINGVDVAYTVVCFGAGFVLGLFVALFVISRKDDKK